MEDEQVTEWFAQVGTSPGVGGIVSQLHGPAVRVVSVGPLFDVVVVATDLGQEACSLLKAANDLGPVVGTELGRLSFLIAPRGRDRWTELVADSGLSAVAQARYLSAGTYLWLPTPVPPPAPWKPMAWWVEHPRMVDGAVRLTDGAHLCAAIGVAVHTLAASALPGSG
ncbi:hypothetical protein B4N89_28010 [Embleya scabrispora]|uniref:DNA primase/polymerase bifunctional N-terminal domain-containing protein n=1 Tax=Embleya scabrispora TaxID=159449 RepID=A0A1T3P5C9_9ACTN|nr:hypothetical protein [Embleya scabrispora]OPC84264.1 hypothetical protein B4N89_28010 [Embleya scabrispora]